MAEIKILVCDLCKDEQRSDDKDIYWALLYRTVYWKVPEDGCNGGEFKGTMCSSCRMKVIGAINVAVAGIKISAEEKTTPKALSHE